MANALYYDPHSRMCAFFGKYSCKVNLPMCCILTGVCINYMEELQGQMGVQNFSKRCPFCINFHSVIVFSEAIPKVFNSGTVAVLAAVRKSRY